MGSCQSTTNNAPGAILVTELETTPTKEPPHSGVKVPLHSDDSDSSRGKSQRPKHHHDHDETTETTSDGSEGGGNKPTVVRRVPSRNGGQQQRHRPRKIRPGYSSGGSSEYSDDTSEPHQHLIDWKNELGSDGDLCKGVVRIETDFGRPIEEVYDGVHTGTVLGSGVSGVVRRVVHKKTGVNYAVKCLDLGLIQTAKGLQALREEIFIMCQLDHPNIVRLEEVYESEHEIYLIQELCTGGDLFDRLDDQSDYHYTEAACAKLVKQILSSIRYLHSKNIIHRDLKLENFLFSTDHPESELRMIDFGLSKHFTYDGELQHECVGTPYTVAPEVIKANYDEKVDIWSLGVISYLLLCGETPFGGADGEPLLHVRENILKGEVKFEPEEVWRHVSDSGKAFVKRMLNPDPTKRPTAKEAQRDPWLLDYGKRSSPPSAALSPKLVESLVQFKEYSDMRKVLCEVLSFTLLPEQIADLRKEFELVDVDGDGEISLCTLRRVLMQNAEAGALGALTEDEISDVFNALRVRKSETKIRWHEFIAAGLSQANFDERNLKLAFDRLDYDRKGYITFEDMKDLLGTSSGDEDGHIEQMWRDGMAECSCPLGRVTFDDFRMFIKGQTKEMAAPCSPRGSRKKLVQLSLDAPSSPMLDVVPEGSASPQPKSKTFPKFDELSGKENVWSLQMPQLGGGDENKNSVTHHFQQHDEETPTSVNISYPADIAPHHKKTRSRSLETPCTAVWLDEDFESEDEDAKKLAGGKGRRSSNFVVLPSRAVGQLKPVINDETKTPLEINKAIYRKHREIRRSVLEGSKMLDRARQARRLQSEMSSETEVENPRDAFVKRASLVMRRGAVPEGTEPPPPPSSLPATPDHEESRRLEAAKRSGRPRRTKTKTTSDISGMLR